MNDSIKQTYDFEVTDVTDKDFMRVSDILNPVEQLTLGNAFKEMYGR